ncbi:polysaccharide deacetylase family protein, PEP-CTERM locus subfamily [Desulfocicer vacuolatum DSM 3385]|uniref:Polysaccharide deacetylase family protein, PEP-CTERM locus subfamily n=1 Tax=Desulfocicer vacuolatum DSM 3385 TaxID=1121400 RepID=A0A1W1ZPK5_9BACT|nr:XrtA system polysaccharide deacetylase [Desulfocicer vacuolatum]SMC50490.1 polysaccharide deacetylase family protein, PEP-CTERM locus subfamily [Desulfocicer vacuolatum DSM 3385]
MTDTILITVDVEDWFQVENFKPWIARSSWHSRELRVEQNCHRLLDLFDGVSGGKVRATFFILGWIARKCPDLVKEIANRGHEVASHGVDHELCTKMTDKALFHDLVRSRKLLEDIISLPVVGYRAPSFAINDKILNIVEQSGYLYDSSYNSFNRHGRYGIIDTDRKHVNGISLRLSDAFHELPVSNLVLSDQVIPMGGGGYFRLLPFFAIKQGVRWILKKQAAYVFYIHPWELDPDQPRVNQAHGGFRFRHYINLADTQEKLTKLIRSFSYCDFKTCSGFLGL